MPVPPATSPGVFALARVESPRIFAGRGPQGIEIHPVVARFLEIVRMEPRAREVFFRQIKALPDERILRACRLLSGSERDPFQALWAAYFPEGSSITPLLKKWLLQEYLPELLHQEGVRQAQSRGIDEDLEVDLPIPIPYPTDPRDFGSFMQILLRNPMVSVLGKRQLRDMIGRTPRPLPHGFSPAKLRPDPDVLEIFELAARLILRLEGLGCRIVKEEKDRQGLLTLAQELGLVRTSLFVNQSARESLRGELQHILESSCRRPEVSFSVEVSRTHPFWMMEHRETRDPGRIERFLKAHFTDREIDFLEKLSGEERYTTVAVMLAQKKIILGRLRSSAEDLGLHDHWLDVEVLYPKYPSVTGDAVNLLGERSLLCARAARGDLGVAVTILESKAGESGFSGIGLGISGRFTPGYQARRDVIVQAALQALFGGVPEEPYFSEFVRQMALQETGDEPGRGFVTYKDDLAAMARSPMSPSKGHKASREPVTATFHVFEACEALVALVLIP